MWVKNNELIVKAATNGYWRISVCFCVCVYNCVCVCVCWAVYPPSWVLCWEGHGPFLLCAGVMAGPLHLHTFACCQTEPLLTASRADCLPGPWPNPVGMVTRHGKAWHARSISPDESFRETSFSGQTSTHTNNLQMSLSEDVKHRRASVFVSSNAEIPWALFSHTLPSPKLKILFPSLLAFSVHLKKN